MKLTSPITDIKGIGEKSAKLFQKLNIETVQDLLHHFPKDYKTFDEPKSILAITNDKPSVGAFVGTISAVPALKYVRKLSVLTVSVRDMDHTGIRLTFFNMPYLKNTLQPGKKYVFYGSIYEKGSFLCMDHPKIYKPEEYQSLLGVLQPVYALTKGISNDMLRKYVNIALEELEPVMEYLPADIIKEHDFMDYASTLRTIHMPGNIAQMTKARKRLSYEEFFFFIMAMKYKRSMENSAENGISFLEVADTKRLIESLPYRLTVSQQNAWKEIEHVFYGRFELFGVSKSVANMPHKYFFDY